MLGLCFWRSWRCVRCWWINWLAAATGASLILGGVIQLLSPQPSGIASKQSADNRIVCVWWCNNTAAQGYPVPPFTAAGESAERLFLPGFMSKIGAVDNIPFYKPPSGAFFYGRDMANKGPQGGSSSSRTPTEQPDDLQSVAKAKILVALGEGEFAGQLTGKDIYLDGTALENADGSQNFSGVTWEFRAGTQAQKYIQGIPGTENEISVGTEVSSATA